MLTLLKLPIDTIFKGMDLDWITDNIAIGNRIEAHDEVFRAQNGFHSLISLDGSMTDKKALTIGYDDWLCVSMIDGPGNDVILCRKVVHLLIGMAEESPPVLVHCHAGRSRSVTVVAGYLVLTKGWSTQVAYGFIAAKRRIDVQIGLRDLLQRILGV